MSGVNKRWVCDCQPAWWGWTELKFGSPHLADDDNDGDDDAPVSSTTLSWTLPVLCITIIVTAGCFGWQHKDRRTCQKTRGKKRRKRWEVGLVFRGEKESVRMKVRWKEDKGGEVEEEQTEKITLKEMMTCRSDLDGDSVGEQICRYSQKVWNDVFEQLEMIQQHIVCSMNSAWCNKYLLKAY